MVASAPPPPPTFYLVMGYLLLTGLAFWWLARLEAPAVLAVLGAR